MSYSLTVGSTTSSIVVEPRITTEYNAMQGATVTVRRDEISTDDAFAEATLSDTDGVIYQGEIDQVHIDQPVDGQVTLELLGPALELQRAAPSSEVSYEWIATHEAIQDYLDNQVGLSTTHTVYKPETSVQSNDTKLRDIPGITASFSEIYSPASDEPIAADGTSLRALQTVLAGTASDFGTSGDLLTDDDSNSWNYINAEYVELESQNTESVSLAVTPEYDIPASRVGVIIHSRLAQSGSLNTDNSFVKFNGTEIADVPADAAKDEDPNADAEFEYHIFETDYADNSGSSLSANTSYTLEFQASSDQADHPIYEIDHMAVYDTDYPPTTWDEPDSLADTIDGPSLYPQDHQIEVEDYLRPWPLFEGRIESKWNDTSNAQQLQLSADDGTNYLTASNSETLTADFDANNLIGTILKPRPTLSGYNSGSEGWLARRDTGQEVTEWRVFATTRDLPLIDTMTLNDDHLSNLQKLHRSGGLRFVVDPTVRSPITLESFQPGEPDVVTTLDDRALDSQRARIVTNYANDVTLVWTDSNGDRKDFRMVDFDEKTRVGEFVGAQVFDGGVSTRQEARVAAQETLLDRIANDEDTGQLEQRPRVILAGYPYRVSEWDDLVADLTRSEFADPATGGRTTLQFQRDRDIAERVANLQE